jgi:hypothetical protein
MGPVVTGLAVPSDRHESVIAADQRPVPVAPFHLIA